MESLGINPPMNFSASERQVNVYRSERKEGKIARQPFRSQLGVALIDLQPLQQISQT